MTLLLLILVLVVAVALFTGTAGPTIIRRQRIVRPPIIEEEIIDDDIDLPAARRPRRIVEY